MNCTRRTARFLRYRLIGALTLAVTAAATAADTSLAYKELTGHKAIARTTTGSVEGIAHSEPHPVTASYEALEACQRRASAADAVCEIVRIDDQDVTTAQTIRSRARERAGDGPRPLYLWRLESRSATIYLAGSIHILKPSLYPLPVEFEAAFERSDHLVVEVDTARLTPDALQSLQVRHGTLAPPNTLESVLPADLYDKVHGKLVRLGIPPSSLAQAKPMLAMNTMMLVELMSFGYRPDQGMEMHFRSRLGEREILQLETVEQQMSLLFGQPLDDQIDMLRDHFDTGDNAERELTSMIVAWMAGDDEAFLRLFRERSGRSDAARTFVRNLLDDRNRHMAQKISMYLQTEGTYFVLIGAAHYVGENGIIALLENSGIPSERLTARF